MIFDVARATLLGEPHVPLGLSFDAITSCYYSILCMSFVYTVNNKELLSGVES